jgi:outer membrane protein assembly factor BamB
MTPLRACRILGISVLLALVPAGSAAEGDWSQWRGPRQNGSSPALSLPAKLGPENLAWSTALPGKAGSTPVLSGDRIFLTSPDSEKNLLLLCLDRKSGKELWRRTVGIGDREVGRNNMCAPSPVVDSERVVVLFGTGDFAAFDLDGKPLWQRNLGKEYGNFAIMWLYGASPLLHQGRLYLPVLQRDEMPQDYPRFDGKSTRESFVLCVDPATGKDLWRHVRKTDSTKESGESYATPIAFQGPNGPELVIVGGDHVSGHRFDDGREIWRARLYEKRDDWYRIVTSPVVAGGFVLASGPKGQPVVAFRGGGSGDVTQTHRAWEFREAPTDWSTPCLYQDHVFVLDGQKRVLSKLNPKDGSKVWSGKVPGSGPIWGSPSAADGKLYCHDENGTVFALSAGEQFEVLGSHAFQGESPCKGSVALADGQVLVRTATSLHAFSGNLPKN